MPATVIVNNLTVVHKSSGGTAVAAFDVCKTPTPTAPLPLPYINTALSRQLARGTKSVRADGQPAMLKSSNIASSTGDEPGTLGGVISGKSRGKALPRSYSLDVKFEGQPIVRFTDMVAQNAGAAPNTAGILSQPSHTLLDLKYHVTELIEMRWSKTQLCCGDPVTLSVRTRNAAPKQNVPILAKRINGLKLNTMEKLDVTIQGDRAEYNWIARWCGKFAEKIPAIAAQSTLLGAERSANTLEFQNPPAVARTRGQQRIMETPKYKLNDETQKWEKTVEVYYWRVAYDVEISEGSMIVWRELFFIPRSGQGPVSPATMRTWIEEIRSIWDRKFFLHRMNCERGARCDCGLIGCCKYPLRIYAVPGRSHGRIDLWVGAPKREDWGKRDLWWYSHTWWTEYGDAGPLVRAHEFGHLIGCYDEYPKGACDPARRFTDCGDSIMGGGNGIHPRHVYQFRQKFEELCSLVGRVELVRVMEG